jgi:hypothetical protein
MENHLVTCNSSYGLERGRRSLTDTETMPAPAAGVNRPTLQIDGRGHIEKEGARAPPRRMGESRKHGAILQGADDHDIGGCRVPEPHARARQAALPSHESAAGAGPAAAHRSFRAWIKSMEKR